MNYTLIENNDAKSIIHRILLNRGIPEENIESYICPTSKEAFSYNLLNNIESAVKTVLKTILSNQKIYVQIDSDCDGYTSAAVLLNYLHKSFPSRVENLVSYAVHDKKHHGINMENITNDIKLVIIPDASSNEVEFHKQLWERGIQTVVLDHHHAPIDPEDPAIIVNNQMCDYPNKSLSGVGIVYKFCEKMDEVLKTSYAKDYLDLVALGMIADMMDLKDLETRFYIVEGLKELKNPFFKAMVAKNEFKIKNELNPFTISWYVAPFINAMTRSGTLEEKQILFKSMLEYEAYKLVPSTKRGCSGQEELLVDQSVRVCGNVKNRQEKEKSATLDMIYQAIEDQHANDLPILIIQIEKSLDNNLNGLMANHIMAEFQKPTLILTKRDKEGVITWEGSGRGYVIEAIADWRSYIENTDTCLYAEGHPNAFGVGFTPEGLEDFKELIAIIFSRTPFEKSYSVDFAWNNKDDFDTAILEIADRKDLWGQGVSEPLIALTVPITRDRVQLMGKGTLKISIQNSQTTCIKFGFGEDKFAELTDFFNFCPEGMLEVVIIGYCRKNEWNGNITPQIEICDYQISKSTAWYF